MTDEELVERLRKRQEFEFIDGYKRVEWEDEDAIEAADRIDALKAELASGSFYQEKDIDAWQNRIEELERACSEWAETSQRNYQCAKAYFEALQLISAPTYGIQGIMEDYEIDSIPYLEATLSYYYRLVTTYQKVAREAIKDVET